MQQVVSISFSIASDVSSDSLLMTCRVCVEASDGSTIEARALLDSMFISKMLANPLSTSAGLSHHTQNHSTTQFTLCSNRSATGKALKLLPLLCLKSRVIYHFTI